MFSALYIDELEELLDVYMGDSLSTVVQDGSVEEVIVYIYLVPHLYPIISTVRFCTGKFG